MTPRYLTSLNLQDFFEAACEIPYQKIESDLFPGIELWIRRDDLLDPLISGNKAYKLIYNLIEAREQGADTLVTCGGAWSNHIHATAAAGARFGFKTIGIIRGERPQVPSATLRDAERLGMQFQFVSRLTYRDRHQANFLETLELGLTNAVYIPEGGANKAGAEGIYLLGAVLGQSAPVSFDEYWLACGTGLTLGALASSLNVDTRLVGVPVLKDGGSIQNEARQWQSQRGGAQARISILRDSHCGGYARYPDYLEVFHREFEQETDVPLDPIYTAKMAYALHKMSTTVDRRHSRLRVLMLHTGGLQGRRGLSNK